MTAEATSIHLHIEADARLAAAAGGAVRYFADMAGIEGPALSHLQSAVISACQQAFPHLTKEHPWLEVTLTRLTDRIEVALASQAQSTTNPEENQRVSTALNGVDRVQYEVQGNTAIVRLTKYIMPTTLRQ